MGAMQQDRCPRTVTAVQGERRQSVEVDEVNGVRVHGGSEVVQLRGDAPAGGGSGEAQSLQ